MKLRVNCAYYADEFFGFEVTSGETWKEKGEINWEYNSDKFYDPVIDFLNGDYISLASAYDHDFYKELGLDDMAERMAELETEYGLRSGVEHIRLRDRRKALAKNDLSELRETNYFNLIEKVLLYNDSLKHLSAAQRYYAFGFSNREIVKGTLDFCSEAHFSVETTSEEFENERAFGDYEKFEKLYKQVPLEERNDFFLNNKRNATFEDICEMFTRDTPPILMYTSHAFNAISDMIKFLTTEMIKKEIFIKRCKNCGKYFVPSRIDTVFCSNVSPQSTEKTCQKYGKYMTYLEKTRNDEATKLYKQIYNSIANKVRRCDGKNEALNSSLDKFKSESKEWRQDIKSGFKKEEEFIKWLKNFKSKHSDK